MLCGWARAAHGIQNPSRSFISSMNFPEHLQPRIFGRHEAELNAEERAIAIGAFCRRIIRDPNSGPELTAVAVQCLREAPEPTDAALERLLCALDRPED